MGQSIYNYRSQIATEKLMFFLFLFRVKLLKERKEASFTIFIKTRYAFQFPFKASTISSITLNPKEKTTRFDSSFFPVNLVTIQSKLTIFKKPIDGVIVLFAMRIGLKERKSRLSFQEMNLGFKRIGSKEWCTLYKVM